MGFWDLFRAKSEPKWPSFEDTYPLFGNTTPTFTLSNVVPALVMTANIVAATCASEKLIAFIEKEEGFVPVAVHDVDGVLILGYGCKYINGAPVVFGQKITREAAHEETVRHVKIYADVIVQAVKRPLRQGELDALVDFVYNAGLGAFVHSTLLLTIRATTGFNSAVTEHLFTEWDKAHIHGVLTTLPNLLARRKAEYQFWVSR